MMEPGATATKRTIRVGIVLYFVVAIAFAIYLIWSGIDGGGLERQHDLRDWVVTILFYAATVALWPILVVVILLMFLGIIHGPITL
jgi:hypothetical protein